MSADCFYNTVAFCLHFTGVIDVLVNIGRQIDAVNLAFAFELTEKFPPVPLLKTYLNEASKVPSPGKSGNTPTVQVCSFCPNVHIARCTLKGWDEWII